jgi:integrase
MGSPFKFWLPILGLFTGLRIEELCQLHPDDLVRVEDIWCLDINEAEGKKVKTESSRRLVPLHPFLTDELNFPGFVAHAANARQTRIFHQLKKQSDRWSHYPSRWFSEFLKKVGLKKPGRKLAFHSFRHTFVRAGKLANVEREKIMEVVGHGSPSKDITFGRYGKQYPPSILFTDVILKLDFGVDLSHLKKSIFVAKRP